MKLLCTPPFSEHLLGCFSHVLFLAYSQNLFSKVVIIFGFHIDIRNMNDVLIVLKAESCLLVFNILRALTPFFQYLNIGLLIFLILAYYSYYQPLKFMNTVNFLRSEKVQQFELIIFLRGTKLTNAETFTSLNDHQHFRKFLQS